MRAAGPPGQTEPEYGPSGKLDIEAEVGFAAGVPSERGLSIGTDAFARHVFGIVLVNDWSARTIQTFEYVPLGPFLGKSFATSVSAWVTPPGVDGPAQHPPVAGYPRRAEPWGLDVTLQVSLNGQVISSPPLRGLYWTPHQMLAHLTGARAALRTGDLFASGAVSGPDRDQAESLIEITRNGAEPIVLGDGSHQAFLAGGDTFTITGTCGCRKPCHLR